MNSYITVKEFAEFHFEDRRSEFIGLAMPVSREEDALNFINSVKKKYPDARHWVYAYILRENSVMRYSDDREPQGTAGMPVLDVIRKNGCTDTVIVVVRYFGGILLGTGGLVHAYTEAALGALNSAKIITYNTYATASVRLSYSDYQKALPVFSEFDYRVDNTDYSEDVMCVGSLLADNYYEFDKKMTEITSGRSKTEKKSEKFDFRE